MFTKETGKNNRTSTVKGLSEKPLPVCKYKRWFRKTDWKTDKGVQIDKDGKPLRKASYKQGKKDRPFCGNR